MLLSFASPATVSAAEKGVVTDLTWGTSPSDQNRTASVITDLGAPWVRLNANWADAEPTPGVYSSWWFEHYDRAVELAHNAGARIVMLSYQSPSWASGSSNPETPPNDPEGFARFMAYLAARYAGKVEAYEVWNEPNWIRFWPTGPDPAAYTRLLKPTYLAIKQADPDAKVLFGGLSTNDYPFVERAYDAGAKGYFDVMDLHPYPCANSPELISHGSDGRMTRDSFPGYREVRASMLARGDDKPIWFTEFGWSTTTQSCGVSESKQSDYLTRAFRLIEQDPYVQVAFWYELRNNYWDYDADNWEAQLGLLRTSFSPKPAYSAFKSYVPTTSQTFNAVADAYVDQSVSTTNYGKSTIVKVNNSPIRRGYLRFNPQGLAGQITQATLQLYATTSSSTGYSVRGVSDSSWGETTINYSNAPAAAGTPTGSSGSFSAGKWISVDVTPLVAGAGPISFGLTTTSSSSMSLASREYGASYAPRLVIATKAVPPSNGSPPTISGTPEVGQQLTAHQGTWRGTGPFWYGFLWRRCDSVGSSCADIRDATSKTYTPASGDLGNTIRVVATTSNAAGWSSARSAPTAPVATPPPQTVIDSGPSGVVASTSAGLSFSSSGQGSTFECSLDGAGFGSCTSPASYDGLSQGSHSFEVRAIDAAGKVDPTPAARTWSVDTIAPAVTSMFPAAGAIGVAVNANLGATFSEPIDRATVTAATYKVVKSSDGTSVAASVSYDGVNRRASLDPTSDLLSSTSYTATVTTAVKDTAGNALAGQVAWSFTTAAAPPPSSGIRRESSATVVNSIATGSVTIARPFGTAAGDVLVSCLALNGGSVAGGPPGWVPIAAVSSISNPHVFGYYRVAGSFEPNSYTWTLASSVASGAGMGRYSGVNDTSPLDAPARTASGASASAGTVPGITTATASAMLIGCMAINSSSTSIAIGSPSGLSDAWDIGGKRHELADGFQVSAGASAKTWTFSAGREWAGWLATLRAR